MQNLMQMYVRFSRMLALLNIFSIIVNVKTLADCEAAIEITKN